LKINVNDGTWKDNAGVAFVFRDLQGRVKLAAIARVATLDLKHAEANTILLGLKLVANLRDG